jgi:hypothetical protein
MSGSEGGMRGCRRPRPPGSTSPGMMQTRFFRVPELFGLVDDGPVSPVHHPDSRLPDILFIETGRLPYRRDSKSAPIEILHGIFQKSDQVMPVNGFPRPPGAADTMKIRWQSARLDGASQFKRFMRRCGIGPETRSVPPRRKAPGVPTIRPSEPVPRCQKFGDRSGPGQDAPPVQDHGPRRKSTDAPRRKRWSPGMRIDPPLHGRNR